VPYDLLQGIASSSIEVEVSKTLRDIDLVDKANTFAKHLSGGQKRKLSIGIAVIGDPKVCSHILLKLIVNFQKQLSEKLNSM
jgi:ABC-type multidrug transport system ATPase subunit